jgi:hypothetical protein
MPSCTLTLTPAPSVSPHCPVQGQTWTAKVKWSGVPNSDLGRPVVWLEATLQRRETPIAPWVNVQVFASLNTLPPFETASGEWTSPEFTAPTVPEGHRSLDARAIGHLQWRDINGNGSTPIEVFQEFPIYAVG